MFYRLLNILKKKEKPYFDPKSGIWNVKIPPSDSDGNNWDGVNTLHKYDSGLREEILNVFSACSNLLIWLWKCRLC